MLGSNVAAGWVGQDKARHLTGWLLAHTCSKPERKLLSVPTAMPKAKSVAHSTGMAMGQQLGTASLATGRALDSK
jgi:hypothetical protein